MKKNYFLERSIFVLFCIMMISNVISYLFQIVLARLCTSTNIYGLCNTLLSIYSILLVPSSCMILVVTNIVATNGGGQETKNTIVMLCLIFFFLGGILSFPILRLLQLNSYLEYYMLLIGASFAIYGSLFVGKIQGKKDFIGFGIQGLLNVIVRLLMLVLLLLGSEGTMMSLAIVVATIISQLYSKRRSKEKIYWINPEHKLIDIPIMKFYLGILFSQLLVSLFINGDILLIRVYFGEKELGLYSAASVVGKIATYVTGAIIAVLFPMTAESVNDINRSRRLLKKALLYSLMVSIMFSCLIFSIGIKLITICMGDKYYVSNKYLVAVMIFVIPFSLLNIQINFINALGEARVVIYTLMGCCLSMILGSYFFHSSILQIMIMAGLVLFVTFVIEYLYCINKLRKELLYE